MNAQTVAEMLKRWREVRRVSQRGLAAKAGVGHISIARVETGHQDPTVGFLTKLADALGISVIALLTGPPTRKATRPVARRTRR